MYEFLNMYSIYTCICRWKSRVLPIVSLFPTRWGQLAQFLQVSESEVLPPASAFESLLYGEGYIRLTFVSRFSVRLLEEVAKVLPALGT